MIIIWAFLIGVFISIFGILTYRKKDLRGRQKYQELTLYMEQLLCSFKRFGSITLSLQDCESLFEETSEMKQVLKKVKEEIQNGVGVFEALGYIEKRYHNRRLCLLHDFLIKAESMGGDSEDALDILHHDLQMWKQRTFFYQKKKMYIRRDCFFAAFLGVTMCFLSLMLIPINLRQQLVTSFIYQMTTIVVLSILCWMVLLVEGKLTGNWLDKGQKYNNTKEYLLVKKNKKGFRFWTAKYYCEKEIQEEFPYWILMVVLYLQQESVYQAVKLTLEKAKGIFRYELQNFLDRLYEEPASLTPYLDFFGEFNLPEVQTGMKILYSVNVNGYSHTGKQIRFLVEENNRLMDQSQRRRFENETNGAGLLRQIPMILASGKVLFDMVVVLGLILEQYGNFL